MRPVDVTGLQRLFGEQAAKALQSMNMSACKRSPSLNTTASMLPSSRNVAPLTILSRHNACAFEYARRRWPPTRHRSATRSAVVWRTAGCLKYEFIGLGHRDFQIEMRGSPQALRTRLVPK
jgi:hypothetical protein